MTELIRTLKENGLTSLQKNELIPLYDKILAGDQQAKDEFVARSVYLIIYIARKHIYHYPDQLDDLISCGIEIVIKTLDKLSKETYETFTTYLYINIKYKLMYYMQKDYKKRKGVFSYDKTIGEEADTFAIFLEDKKIDINKYVSKMDFENAIKDLTPIELTVIIESCIENLSIKEIADKNNMKETNVRFIKQCALKKLTGLLSDYVQENKSHEDFNEWSIIGDYFKKWMN